MMKFVVSFWEHDGSFKLNLNAKKHRRIITGENARECNAKWINFISNQDITRYIDSRIEGVFEGEDAEKFNYLEEI